MAFDSRHFFALAKQIAKLRTESALRTAVGRAYYSVFLVARDRTGVRGGKKVHRKTIEKVSKQDPSTAQELDSLLKLRIASDYFLTPSRKYRSWTANWSRAESIVNRIDKRVRQLRRL